MSSHFLFTTFKDFRRLKNSSPNVKNNVELIGKEETKLCFTAQSFLFDVSLPIHEKSEDLLLLLCSIPKFWSQTSLVTEFILHFFGVKSQFLKFVYNFRFSQVNNKKRGKIQILRLCSIPKSWSFFQA